MMAVMRKVIQVARIAPVLAASGTHLSELEIWDTNTCEKLAGFHTVYDDSWRFAINSTGNRVIAANWRKGQKGGVACL
jgi:hypothetical protein